MGLILAPCPVCQKDLPPARALWGLGKTFNCARCGAALVVPRNYSIGIISFVAFWLLKDYVDSPAGMVALVVILVLVVLLLSRLMVIPRRV